MNHQKSNSRVTRRCRATSATGPRFIVELAPRCGMVARRSAYSHCQEPKTTEEGSLVGGELAGGAARLLWC
jgi:hypothetical protein